VIDERAVPRLSPGIRLREDPVRGGWVLLAPERLFMPDEHALAVLRLLDGERSVAAIIDDLAARYAAARAVVAADVVELLRDLTERGVIRV
jgi:pyrroloquinoline quinone biosynthesis protein D